ncbi:MAG: hypothetical protein LM572_01560 [Ignisphaera sp.]|nr:hypothetical protein [Ignisphaera sp.]
MYNINVEILKKILNCSIALEEKLSKVYLSLAKKVSELSAKVLLEIIAFESEKHALILREIANLLNLALQSIDCREFLGALYIDLERVEYELHKKESLGLEELAKLLESLIIIENFAGEETYHKLLLPLIKDFISRDYFITMLIDKIVSDEKFHEKAIESIIHFSKTGTS